MGFQASRHVFYNFLAQNEVRIKVKQQKLGEWTAKKDKVCPTLKYRKKILEDRFRFYSSAPHFV